MNPDEMVYCVSRHQLGDLAAHNGFFRGASLPPLEVGVFEPSFRPRGQVEHDPEVKQLIPYVVLRRLDQICSYFRVEPGGETRLTGKQSIGIGGHVNPPDAHPLIPGGVMQAVRHAALREVIEETGIRNFTEFREVGIVNDETDDVGRVHLGIVYLADVASDKPDWGPGMHVANWNHPERLMPSIMEKWSYHVLNWLLGQMRVPA